jgi:hypothetical protein
MPKATKTVAPNHPDAKLIGWCRDAIAKHKLAESSFTDDLYDESMTLLDDKIMPTAPKTPKGLREKALAMFLLGWQSHCNGETLDDQIVFTLLNDIGINRTELPTNI